MPIRRPSATDVGALITALGSPNPVRREAAIARLTIIGAPAFDRLAAVHAEPGTPREVLTAILRIFEATANPRALVAARRSLKVGGDVAVAAAATLRALLASSDPDTSSAALDSLMVVATDPAAERRVRGAAVDALQELPPDARARVKFALDAGASPAPRGARQPRAHPTDAVWADAVEGRLPDDAATLRGALTQHASAAPLGSLQKLVDLVRRREEREPAPARAAEWRALRGALHQALALRGSRVALYDLRETTAASAAPLPSGYIAALQAIGDVSCLDAIARAFVSVPPDSPAAYQLATAFRTVVGREPRARAKTALDRIAARWPDAAAILSTPSRTTPRRKPRDRT